MCPCSGRGDETLEARKALLIEQRDLMLSRMAELQASINRLNQKIEHYEQSVMAKEARLRRRDA